MYWFAYWYKMFWPKWHEINNMEKYYNKVHITFSIFQDCRIISDFIKKKKNLKFGCVLILSIQKLNQKYYTKALLN